MPTRRAFLHSTAALLAAACTRPGTLRHGARAHPLLGFSTLGTPAWTWQQVIDFAVAHGYGAIELRGLLTEMDLTRVPELTAPRVDETRRQLADRGLRISCLGASANMHEMDDAKRAPQLAEARRFIDLAQTLGAPYVRVFPNRWVAGVERDRVLDRIVGGLRELGTHARDRNVTVLLESHGDITDAPTLRELMRRADSPAVALLWDAHHTFAFSGESPEESVRLIGPWIRHVHLKDSVPAANGARRYVLTGTGEVPVRRQVEALVRSGYTGVYSIEWEKRWRPEIEDPEVALPHFARVAAGYLRDAGASAAPAPGRGEDAALTRQPSAAP